MSLFIGPDVLKVFSFWRRDEDPFVLAKRGHKQMKGLKARKQKIKKPKPDSKINQLRKGG